MIKFDLGLPLDIPTGKEVLPRLEQFVNKKRKFKKL